MGVCFFELLAGRLPFECNSRSEMLYSHLARDPPKIAQNFNEISSCLSEVIYKLMAKPPGDRYQSAEGILRDLEHCRTCIVGSSHNPEHKDWVPGRYDVSCIFKIPSKLYGREKEYDQLLQCLEHAKSNSEVTQKSLNLR